MKLKMALVAVALIAVSAWAGVNKIGIPPYSASFSSDEFTPTASILGPDVDGDGVKDVFVVLVTKGTYVKTTFGIFSVSKKMYVYQWDTCLTASLYQYVSEADFDFAPDGKSFCFGGDYFTIDGTTAASSNP